MTVPQHRLIALVIAACLGLTACGLEELGLGGGNTVSGAFQAQICD